MSSFINNELEVHFNLLPLTRKFEYSLELLTIIYLFLVLVKIS